MSGKHQSIIVEAEWYQYKAGQENNETEHSPEINFNSERNSVFEAKGISNCWEEVTVTMFC